MFISTSHKSILFKKFMELKRNGRPVLDYVSNFEALSKYVLEHVSTPYKNDLKFVNGLKKYLKRPLLLQLDRSFKKLVDVALHLEAVEKEMDSNDDVGVRKNHGKKKFSSHNAKSFPNKKKKTVG